MLRQNLFGVERAYDQYLCAELILGINPDTHETTQRVRGTSMEVNAPALCWSGQTLRVTGRPFGTRALLFIIAADLCYLVIMACHSSYFLSYLLFVCQCVYS